jgi:hypothetical protein
VNPRSGVETALGVAGIWLMVSRIPEFGTSLALWPVGPDGTLHWVGVIHFTLVVGCGLGLLLLRRSIAARLIPAEQPDLTGSVPGLQAAAFSVIGVVLFARGLADLLGRVVMAVSYSGPISVSWFAPAVAQMIVGVGLFLGARGLVSLWHSVRRTAHRQGDER